VSAAGPIRGLELEHITKRFPGVCALDAVSFDVRPGEVHALVGENGAGKSTLMKVLGGAYLPDEGRLRLDGVPLPVGDPQAIQARGVQIIHQELMLVPQLSAAENIFLGREPGGVRLDRRRMRVEAQALLDRLGGGIDARTRVARLRVPQRQLVEIARALAGAPRVLVLDEPTSTLPAPDAQRLLALVKQLRADGLAIIYISHRLDEIYELADRISVLRDGRHVGTKPRTELTRPALIRWMVGRDLAEEFPPRAPKPGAVVLEAEDLLAGTHFEVRAGEIVGLAGLVGSGRTEAGLALFGAHPTRGTIRLHGRAATFASPADALRAGVAYLTEDRKDAGILRWLDVGTNITLASLSRFVTCGWLHRRAERAAAREEARRFDVRSAGLRQLAGTLSGGNQQKLLLARYLLEPRKILILDEPTRGIDVGAKAEIYALMNRLTDEGLGILMISSEMEELLGMSDRIVVMHEGRTVGGLSRAEATQEKVMALATGGEAA
jgi:ribose transport system ATP-binding protein